MSGAVDVPWTTLERAELVDAYWDHVAPAMREEGLDPECDRPTYEWLADQGFRGLIYALREYHDRTFREFWAGDLGLESTMQGYDWGIGDERTVDLLESYLESRRDRTDLSDASEETLRYRLATYARAYDAVNGTGDLLSPVAPGAAVPPHEATEAAWAAFDHLDAELAPRTLRRIHGAVDAWYAHLVRRRRAALNPVSGLEDEYRWDRRFAEDEATNPALDADHVRRLHGAASTSREELLVVALCAWGLRSGEVAALRRDQLVLDDPDAEVPYVTFDARKNGPGEVSILFGRAAAERRLTDVDESREYVFPSDRSVSGHVSRQTILNWFDELADRADLPDTIGGRKPVPQMARRFWYDAYTATREALISEVEEIAREQGSASAEVVLREYLSPSRRRSLRRTLMRERLAAAFDDE